MSNDFFTSSISLTAFTRARSSSINSLSAQIETAFDKLPGEEELRENRVTTVAAGGTADALTATLSPAPTALNDGLHVRLKAGADNTGAATLNVNGLGAVAIKRIDGDDLEAGDLVSGAYADLVYNGTNFILQTSAVALTAAGSVSNAKLADMAAYTIKLRNSASSGDPGDVKISALTEEATPASGDWLLGEESGGALRKFNVSKFALASSFSVFGLTLVDDANAAAARTTLGLGSIATQAAGAVAITGGSVAGITDLAVADGGTGASTAAAARANLGVATQYHVNITSGTNVNSPVPSAWLDSSKVTQPSGSATDYVIDISGLGLSNAPIVHVTAEGVNDRFASVMARSATSISVAIWDVVSAAQVNNNFALTVISNG